MITWSKKPDFDILKTLFRIYIQTMSCTGVQIKSAQMSMRLTIGEKTAAFLPWEISLCLGSSIPFLTPLSSLSVHYVDRGKSMPAMPTLHLYIMCIKVTWNISAKLYIDSHLQVRLYIKQANKAFLRKYLKRLRQKISWGRKCLFFRIFSISIFLPLGLWKKGGQLASPHGKRVNSL